METQLNSAFFTYLMNKDAGKEGALLGALKRGLQLLERSLEESGGPYLMDQSFTLADVQFGIGGISVLSGTRVVQKVDRGQLQFWWIEQK
jgi:glutathione S-transferase